jgi:hypothetical protein
VKFKNIILSTTLLLSIAMLPSSARFFNFDPETTIIDLEDVFNLFKKRHRQTVKIVNNEDSPMKIFFAEVSDRGTRRFDDMKGAVDDFQVKVQNISGKPILTYEVSWTMRHPFEEYIIKKVSVNSIDKLDVGKTQKLEFRKDKYHRNDTFYYVEVTRVEFEDETIWEAPEKEDDFFTQINSIKNEIDTLEEKSIEDMTLEEIKQRSNIEAPID